MTDVGLARFNQSPAAAVDDVALACCASSAWLTAILAGRPYPDRAALLATSARTLADLDWDDVGQALAAHPRIGDRVAGSGQEASWSRTEQSGMDGAPASVREALVEANRAYEQRFGHVFLIFASGRTDVEMLAAARERVDNNVDTERAIVRRELTRIVDRRLTVLLDGWSES